MADYETVLGIVDTECRNAGTAPADLQDTPTLDAWLNGIISATVTELGNQSYTEEEGTFAGSYNGSRDEVTFTWDTSAQQQAARAPLDASGPLLPGPF